ncbi:MAG TPA: hypothetical protein EYP93_02280 [Gammaproteobacteria bacterium]|nr:hypothetical protein [Gammaproteobacteria bacterium]
MSNYRRGVLMILGSAFFLSTSGIGLRIIEQANGWQILFYRSISMMLMVFVVLAFTHRGQVIARFRRLTGEDWLLAVVLGSGFVAYVFALLETTVANALFIFSSAPFIAAVLGWLILRERVAPRTWVAIAAAMIGLGIMVGGGLTGERQLGNLIALWLPLSYSISVILVRRSKQPDMLVALCLAAGVATLSTLPFVGEFSISGHDLGVSLYLGIFQVGAGFILMVLGARYVPAAQVGLLALVEPVLGPLWAWFVVAEMPAQVTLLGGAIILGAVGLDGIISIARKNPGSAGGNR